MKRKKRSISDKGNMCAKSRFFGKRGGHYCVQKQGHAGKHGPFCCVRHDRAERASRKEK